VSAVPETIAGLDAEHEAEHPHSDAIYIKVALFLGVLTALEVATYYIDMSSVALIAVLYPMMTIKFGVVAWWFMHLKFDSALFRRLFLTGIVLAVIVYCIVLFAFDEFF
jgi:cytochrome c oxidase subunit 4